MILLCVALWTLGLENSAVQSTIVAVTTPEEIYISADSKVIDPMHPSFNSTACKIRKIGNLFFAFAGDIQIPGLHPGLMEAVQEYMAGGTDIWDAGYEKGIRRPITIQVKADPEHVGPPIDILRIGKTGYKWIQKKPECFE